MRGRGRSSRGSGLLLRLHSFFGFFEDEEVEFFFFVVEVEERKTGIPIFKAFQLLVPYSGDRAASRSIVGHRLFSRETPISCNAAAREPLRAVDETRTSCRNKKVRFPFGLPVRPSLFSFPSWKEAWLSPTLPKNSPRMSSLAPWRCCSSTCSSLPSPFSSSATIARRSNCASLFFAVVVAAAGMRRSHHRRLPLRVAQVRCRGGLSFYFGAAA